jgi:predicted GH43/DUF377 family glycosyl hydrolase
MKWRKLGLVHRPGSGPRWADRYASFPTAVVLETDLVRVYFTSLDQNNFGRGGYVDLDARNPTRTVAISQTPVLDLGPIGDFDDSGVNPFTVVAVNGRLLMYYQGWQRTVRAPFAIFTGLAIDSGDGEFRKWSRAPVLDRTNEEPHIRGAPFVIADNDKLAMWYVSSSVWSQRGDHLHYRVEIRHAISTDGIHWTTDPHVCLSPGPGEYAVGRPVVIKEAGFYRMWYSIRSFDRPYRIGYAESSDGLQWTRKDGQAGISASESGWDSEMICYPFVIRLGGHLTMFYNGNQHGASGFGCAVLE